MDFFTSDTHLFHKLMVNKERYISPYRDYSSVEEMNASMVDKINKQAKKGDTIYVLGDFSFGKPEQTREILKAINARVVLVKGNHDHRKNKRFDTAVEYADALKEYHMYLERKFLLPGEIEQLIVMFHFPIMHWHKQHYGSWHLFGHLHGNPSGVPGKCMDIGWDCWGRLLTLQDIAKEMAKKPERGNHHVERHDL